MIGKLALALSGVVGLTAATVPVQPQPFAVIARWEFPTQIPGYDPAKPGSGDYHNKGTIWEKSPLSGFHINKQYDDSQLWVQVFGDFVPEAGNTAPDNYFAGMWMDGKNMASVALTCLPARDCTFVINDFMTGQWAAGDHLVDIMIGSGGGSRAAYQFSTAWEVRLMEVTGLPPAQAPRKP